MPSWSFSGSFLYDSGQEGMYSQWGVTWQPLLCESVAMVNTVSLGFSHDYLGRNGLKELMVRTGARWAVSGSLRLEPFLGWYCGYGRDDFKKWCWAFGALTFFNGRISPVFRHFPVAKRGGLVIMTRVL